MFSFIYLSYLLNFCLEATVCDKHLILEMVEKNKNIYYSSLFFVRGFGLDSVYSTISLADNKWPQSYRPSSSSKRTVLFPNVILCMVCMHKTRSNSAEAHDTSCPTELDGGCYRDKIPHKCILVAFLS